MPERIAVVIFANSFRVGGSERQAVELAKHIDRTRFQPVVVCFQKDGPLSAELPDGLQGVEAFPLTGFFRRTWFREAKRFIRFVRSLRPHVLQCFDFYSNVFAIPLARLAGVPVILGARREEALTKSASQRMAELWSYRLATGIVTNAEALREQLATRDGVKSTRIWTVRNGLDVRRFDHERRSRLFEHLREDETLTIGVIGNLRPEKGHLTFLDAAQRLSRSFPTARFLIVGEGPMRTRIEVRIQELGLNTLVKMAGTVTNIPAVLRSIDIAVLPSLSNEGFPNAIMEAMASSLPVVATDTGGTRELVVDGFTGYIVTPGNTAALADRIGKLCLSPETRYKMGEAGRERVQKEFTVVHMAEKFENLYLSLLEKSQRLN